MIKLSLNQWACEIVDYYFPISTLWVFVLPRKTRVWEKKVPKSSCKVAIWVVNEEEQRRSHTELSGVLNDMNIDPLC